MGPRDGLVVGAGLLLLLAAANDRVRTGGKKVRLPEFKRRPWEIDEITIEPYALSGPQYGPGLGGDMAGAGGTVQGLIGGGPVGYTCSGSWVEITSSCTPYINGVLEGGRWKTEAEGMAIRLPTGAGVQRVMIEAELPYEPYEWENLFVGNGNSNDYVKMENFPDYKGVLYWNLPATDSVYVRSIVAPGPGAPSPANPIRFRVWKCQ